MLHIALKMVLKRSLDIENFGFGYKYETCLTCLVGNCSDVFKFYIIFIHTHKYLHISIHETIFSIQKTISQLLLLLFYLCFRIKIYVMRVRMFCTQFELCYLPIQLLTQLLLLLSFESRRFQLARLSGRSCFPVEE